MLAYTNGDIVTLIASLTAAIVAIINALKTSKVGAVAQAIHTEVKTINGLAIGQLADATETRRIEAISPEDRTLAEQHHVDVVPIPTPANPNPTSGE